MSTARLVACEYCDALYRRAPLAPGAVARCARCGGELYRDRNLNVDALLALSVGSAVVLAIANAFPIVVIELSGMRREATLWGAVLATWDAGVGPIAALAALTVFFFPLLQALLFAHVLFALRRRCVGPSFRPAMHALRYLAPWSMVEVFLLGIFVSIVKLAGTWEIIPGPGLWSFLALTALLTMLGSVPLHELWDLAGEQA